MIGNTILNKAKYSDNTDEWYTDYQAIENEVTHYATQLNGQTILCNCNDSANSAFTHFFIRNFNEFHLKKLICVSYADSRMLEDCDFEFDGAYALILEALPQLDLTILDEARVLQICKKYGKIKKLGGNGDFSSRECLKFLEEADIVITNPRFSKFKELYSLLLKYHKKYLLISNQNAITYKEVFPQIKNNLARVGYNFGDMSFKVPHYTEPRTTRFWIDAFGQKWRSLGNAMWLTNLEISRNCNSLVLENQYSKDQYPHYDNYDAIHVAKVVEIPRDYLGIMGVPLTYLKYHNEQVFEIVGEANHGSDNEYDLFKPLLNGKETFKRILIKRRVELPNYAI